MRIGSLSRKLPALLVLAAGMALGGCENQALLQWFDNKPKLQGTRVPVFPEGVPGVQQGVPPELVKGYQSQVDQQAQSAAEDVQKAAEEEKKRAQAEAAAERRKAQQAARAAQPRPARPRPQPAAAEPQQEAAPAPPQQAQAPTSAPLADRWPSAQESQPQQQQQPQQPQPAYSQTRPWPGAAPASGPPTDRFSR